MSRARAIALALAAGLAQPSAAAEGPRPFSHRDHVLGAEAACAVCHPDRSAPGAPAVDRAACRRCHEGGAPAHLPVARPAPLGLPATFAPFPHLRHARAVDCLECHQAVLQPAAEPAPVLEKARCSGCHAGRGLAGVQAACAGCHGADQRKVRPADHGAGWTLRHGPESRLRAFGEHGRDCAPCHGADTCRACHRVQAPHSHTGLWRLRAHGAAAGWDREGCKACHEAGTCVACHREARPINHTAAWRSVHGLAARTADNQSCAACHNRGFCAACHQR